MTKCGRRPEDTGHTASGVKLAGTQYRPFQGTSELYTVRPNRERKPAPVVRWGIGDRPNRSSDEVPVTGMERRNRHVWFQTSLQPSNLG